MMIILLFNYNATILWPIFKIVNFKNIIDSFNPLEKYSKFKISKPEVFQPHFVIHDGKCLSFQGYFRQETSELNSEKHQFRKINLIYYLEDDTLTVIEPPIPVSLG